MEKHLEIFKHIEELYHDDITDEEILEYAEKNSAKMEMWKQAFEGYLLRDVLDAIDEYFSHKNNRTPPRIAQIKAVLNASHIFDEREQHQEKNEKVEACIGYQYAMQDKIDGNMRWFVPDYIEVEKLIRQDKWLFVHNIYHPTLDEFHRCLELYCEEQNGKKMRFFSDNDIAEMSDEKREALRQRCQEVINEFKLRKLN